MKNFAKKLKMKRGFMMVEILVATSIMVIIVLATMTVVQKGLSVSHQSLHVTQASFLLEEGANAVRISRDNAWSNISNLSTSTTYYPTFTGGTWILSTTPNQVDAFTRTVTISAVNRDAGTGDIVSSGGTLDPGTKLVTVNVSWLESGQTVSKNLSFYISNIFP
jgi:Tfp pilus assembly protein PilV